MATISSKKIVDELIMADGLYPGDNRRVWKIVCYQNAFDGQLAYGLIYEGESPERYAASDFIRNPQVIWEYKPPRPFTIGAVLENKRRLDDE
jgi:hypothetical protein